MTRIKIGFAPTRRFVFSKEDALKFKKLTKDFISQYDIDIVDIDDINDEGLLFDSIKNAQMVVEKFKREKVDAVFPPPTVTSVQRIQWQELQRR